MASRLLIFPQQTDAHYPLVCQKESQIFTYPFLNYRNVILDNLSYYVLYHICMNRNVFFHEFYNGFLSLIDHIAVSKSTTVYLIDTPLSQWGFLEKDEKELIYQIFFSILHKAEKIQRYYKGDIVCQITEEKGIDYFFTYEEGSVL